MSQAATCGVLQISQNSQGNTIVRVSFLIRLQTSGLEHLRLLLIKEHLRLLLLQYLKYIIKVSYPVGTYWFKFNKNINGFKKCRRYGKSYREFWNVFGKYLHQ